MEAIAKNNPAENVKPPATSVGVIGWMRANLFNGWFNSLLTIITVLFFYKIIPPLMQWALLDSVWLSDGGICRDAEGACWAIIAANWLTEAGGAVRIADRKDLVAQFLHLLTSAEEREKMGQHARAVVISHQGAVCKTVNALSGCLKSHEANR